MNCTLKTTGIDVVVVEGLNKTLSNGRKHISELERVLWGSSDFNKTSEFPEDRLLVMWQPRPCEHSNF